jgi:hypothetical protein
LFDETIVGMVSCHLAALSMETMQWRTLKHRSFLLLLQHYLQNMIKTTSLLAVWLLGVVGVGAQLIAVQECMAQHIETDDTPLSLLLQDTFLAVLTKEGVASAKWEGNKIRSLANHLSSSLAEIAIPYSVCVRMQQFSCPFKDKGDLGGTDSSKNDLGNQIATDSWEPIVSGWGQTTPQDTSDIVQALDQAFPPSPEFSSELEGNPLL